MQLRLLGPFEAGAPGSNLPLPGRGERALLALLALSAGRTVGTSTLIDALWAPDELPEDAVNALQIRVSRLRRALKAMGAADVLSRQASGYRLDVPPDDVDVHRFAELIRGARDTDDTPAAVTAYSAALALWRGTPLSDFASEPWSTVEVGRLTELRLAALAERAELMLELGRADEVVADLSPVVIEAPTREKLVRHLMVALFNAGRQADALDVYARTRAALTDELGLDASPELRTAMEQILNQDPELGRVRARSAVSQPLPNGGLPQRSTSFVGRDDALDHTVRQLSESRLVTLVGPGGAGKTTLGIEVARRAADASADGVWLIRLAPVSEPRLVEHTVAEALGASVHSSPSPRDAIVNVLSTRRALLVLDNCEHLLLPIAALAEALLEACPGVRILATSREPLAVPGETRVPVAPLAVPDPDTPVERIPDYPAVQLLLHRARAAGADLGSDPDTLRAVAVICRQLDGIPLALELAAVRLNSLSAKELAERVQDRFAVLTTGSRTADARQQTLRAAVDWSHDLLTRAEQTLFRRFAVFRGGCTLAAAEAVLAGDDLPVSRVFDLLDRLVTQSLVLADTQPGRTRYRMLETLRQYAADKLDESGERPTVARAHADHFLRTAEQAEGGLRGAGQARWMRTLHEDNANLRVALAWWAEHNPDAALRMAGSLGLFWHMGRHLEGRETLRGLLAQPGGDPGARARALLAASLVERPRASIVHPSEQCAAAAAESLTTFVAAGDRRRAALARALVAVEGVPANSPGDVGPLLAESERAFTELGDDWGRGVVAFVEMEVLAKRGDMAAMRRSAERAISLFRSMDDGWGRSAVLYHYGWALQRFGRYADAVPVLEQAIDVAAPAGVHNTVQWATADLGLALLAIGRTAEAHARFDEARDVSARVGDDAGRMLATYGAAVAARVRGEYATARPLFAQAHRGFSSLAVALATGLALAGMAASDEALGDSSAACDGYQQLLEAGIAAGEVGLIACALEGLGRSALTGGDAVAAAEHLGHAADLRRRYDRPADPVDGLMTEPAVAAARAALGGAAYEAAAARGAEFALTAPATPERERTAG